MYQLASRNKTSTSHTIAEGLLPNSWTFHVDCHPFFTPDLTFGSFGGDVIGSHPSDLGCFIRRTTLISRPPLENTGEVPRGLMGLPLHPNLFDSFKGTIAHHKQSEPYLAVRRELCTPPRLIPLIPTHVAPEASPQTVRLAVLGANWNKMGRGPR
ncbi:hypothetical protein CEXT_790771 [Caerostris extrusa]|uniref:Uncharacterized protein n=1 Tax=Caerostris extrusa TaxID=172846 RepID=A0AAV4VXP4_CAEEX|nr:hypothetical protein CEXT_790771 [Caerostris extrusa]